MHLGEDCPDLRANPNRRLWGVRRRQGVSRVCALCVLVPFSSRRAAERPALINETKGRQEFCCRPVLRSGGVISPVLYVRDGTGRRRFCVGDVYFVRLLLICLCYVPCLSRILHRSEEAWLHQYSTTRTTGVVMRLRRFCASGVLVSWA